MGNALCACSDKEKSPSGKRPSFKFTESPHRAIIILSDSEMPIGFEDLPPDTNFIDDGKEHLPFATGKSELKLDEESINFKSSTYTKECQLRKPRNRNNTDPEQAQIAYSSKSNVLERTIFVDEDLLEALAAKPQQQLPVPATQRLSLSRRSTSYMKRKDRLNEDVRIVYADSGASKAKPELYKLVIALNEVWKKLDIDQDNHLNMSELTRFCKKIWEEPVEDGGAGKIMEVYADEHPEKGVNFHEWCILIKEEDPDLQEFVEEIYEIFVDPADSQLATESEVGI